MISCLNLKTNTKQKEKNMRNEKEDKKSEEYFEKHMHDGHRLRLLSTVSEVGLDHLSDIQVLEYILFYIFPRGDVNPLAHRLLARFGSVFNVLEASVHDLKQVKGMGETSAKKLNALMSVYDYYALDKINKACSIDNFNEFIDGIEALLRFKNNELCYIFGIGPSGAICHGRLFSRGDVSAVNFEVSDLASYIATYKVKMIIFVHNHPGGSCFPSSNDNESLIRLKKFLALCGVQLYDSFIIGKNGIFSCIANAIRRHFTLDEEQEELQGKSQQLLKSMPKGE